jgi:phosphoribosylaminoimidazole-succinocarboxamide synthase
MDLDKLAPYLGKIVSSPDVQGAIGHYSGKVREAYDFADNTRMLITTDRISAFDIILALIPLKGQALTQTAKYWFEVTADICPNHVVAYPDPNVLVGKKLSMLPVEIVVRDYMTGTTSTSIWPMYKSGKRTMYGIDFPEGLRENQKLPRTIITPTTKADLNFHDEAISMADIRANKLLTEEQADIISDIALKLFARGREKAAEKGLILVDTKYEFGIDETGRIVLADEIHTPDSSRYWLSESYTERFEQGTAPDSFDKDVIRRWVNSQCDPYKDKVPTIPDEFILKTAATYIGACEMITGKHFDFPDPDEDPNERIARNVSKYLKR